MPAILRQPKWLVAGLTVALLAAVFIRLGFWQLSRLEERQTANQVGQTRLEAEPIPLSDLLAQAGGDLDSIQYRRVVATGTWDVAQEVLVRSQVEQGTAGFHVITPLVGEDGTAVLVNRGWVPLTLDNPPVAEASPPAGESPVGAWVHLSQTRPPFGAEEPAGDLDVFNRVDIDRISEQLPYELDPVYLVATGENEELPITVDLPDFSDEGPHLAYAIQWFGFAAVGLIGFYFLARRKGGQGR